MNSENMMTTREIVDHVEEQGFVSIPIVSKEHALRIKTAVSSAKTYKYRDTDELFKPRYKLKFIIREDFLIIEKSDLARIPVEVNEK